MTLVQRIIIITAAALGFALLLNGLVHAEPTLGICGLPVNTALETQREVQPPVQGSEPLPWQTLAQVKEAATNSYTGECQEQSVEMLQLRQGTTTYYMYRMGQRFTLASVPDGRQMGTGPEHVWFGTVDGDTLKVKHDEPYDPDRHGQSACPYLLNGD